MGIKNKCLTLISLGMLFAKFDLVTLQIISRSYIFKIDLDFKNKVFTQNLNFDSLARSPFDCSSVCRDDINCVTFTFSQLSKRCRGHSTIMNSHDATINEPMSSTYYFKDGGRGKHEILLISNQRGQNYVACIFEMFFKNKQRAMMMNMYYI